VYIRHGKSLKAEDDKSRILAPEGEVQARQRRIKLGNPKFDLVMASPVTRAITTAQLTADDSEVFSVRALYTPDDRDGKLLDILFEKLGYAPLSEYEKEDGGALNRVADAAIAAIYSAIKSFRAQHVLVVGHAVFLNAIACRLNRRGGEVLHETVLGECEGFVDDGECITLIRD
jgi:broad specificity phosphatase PhoE